MSDELKKNVFVVLCLFFSKINSSEGITISKDGTFHRLKIHKVTEEFAGKYKFEADGRKTEATIVVEGRNIFLLKVTSLHMRPESFINLCQQIMAMMKLIKGAARYCTVYIMHRIRCTHDILK